MTQSYNISPYYDDFDEDKNFYRVMFKPGVSVQARELTQLQTILQDQIKKFGNHVFKNGSVVIPGNSFAELTVPYVKLQTTSVDLTQFEGKMIVGDTSGIRAYVKKVVAAESGDPATFYLAYMGGGSSGQLVFADNELIKLENNLTITVNAALTASTGYGSLASVTRGVFYVGGTFVGVKPQSIVIAKYTSTPSVHVYLKLVETIIDSDADQSLLDPSNGEYNFAAPGADRLNIELILISTPLSSGVISDDYIELMRYNNGVLEEHLKYPKYNELEKSLARRTFDESGDYVVRGLEATVQEHLRTDNNGGKFFAADGGSTDKFVLNVSAGKAYVKGFEVDKEAISINVDKARGAAHIKTRTNNALYPKFGQSLFVGNVDLPPLVATFSVVDLHNTSTPGSGTKIGTARLTGIEFWSGVAGENGVYQAHFIDMILNSGNNSDQIGSISLAGATTPVAKVLQRLTVPGSVKDFTVGELVNFNLTTRQSTAYYYDRTQSALYVFKHISGTEAPALGDIVLGATSGASGTVTAKVVIDANPGNTSVLRLPSDEVYKLRNASDALDIEYKVWKEFNMSASGGTGSITVSGGATFLSVTSDTFMAIDPSGVVLTSGFTKTSDTSITYSGTAFASIRIYVVVVKKAIGQRSKTPTIGSLSAVTPAASISLGLPDVYDVPTIISTVDGDVTNRYALDNGQRDYYYGIASINIKSGYAVPAGTLTISFKYFTASAGDFFTVDSYTGLGASYLDNIPNYKSRGDGQTYILQNCIDFRPYMTDTTTVAAGDMLALDYSITFSLKYFVPRVDYLYTNQSGEVLVAKGIPGDVPAVPSIPSDSMGIAQINIPAYTHKVTDIVVRADKNRGYTMKAVGGLEDRVANLEEYATLTALESSLLNTEVIDAATGLSRFKSGYLSEDFSNAELIGQWQNVDFKATYVDGVLFPAMEQDESSVFMTDASTDYQLLNDVVTLPYTEVPFVIQKMSTRITNINPFAVVSWNGNLKLYPSVDSWVDITNLEAIKINWFEDIVVNNYMNWNDTRSWQTVTRSGMLLAPTANGSTTTDPSWVAAKMWIAGNYIQRAEPPRIYVDYVTNPFTG